MLRIKQRSWGQSTHCKAEQPWMLNCRECLGLHASPYSANECKWLQHKTMPRGDIFRRSKVQNHLGNGQTWAEAWQTCVAGWAGGWTAGGLRGSVIPLSQPHEQVSDEALQRLPEFEPQQPLGRVIWCDHGCQLTTVVVLQNFNHDLSAFATGKPCLNLTWCEGFTWGHCSRCICALGAVLCQSEWGHAKPRLVNMMRCSQSFPWLPVLARSWE